MGDAVIIRPATLDDAPQIAAIYAHYVDHSVITFETEALSADDMAARIRRILPAYPFLVAVEGGQIAGYAYAGQVYDRAAYRWIAETSVYLAIDAQGRGLGTRLYRALLTALEAQGFQAAIGKITLPNPASTTLHEKLGFVRCGVFGRVGYKHGDWHDVGLYQLDFGERPTEPAETLPSA